MNKKLKALIVAIGAGLSAVLYRMGGSGNYPRQARIVGVSALSVLILALLRGKVGLWLVVAYLACVGLSIAAISTYYDELPFNKGKDSMWLHGFGLGMAFVPLVWFGIVWWLIVVRAITLALTMGLLNKYANKWHWKHSDIIEECGRGALIILTLPLLLI